MASQTETLLAALRAGDEASFRDLVVRNQAAMVRVAAAYVPSRAVAEEVVQETWLAVLEGLDRFEARSSLRTWIFRILINRAKSRGVREHRSIPVSAFEGDDEDGDDAPSVDHDRFFPAEHRWAGHWSRAPERWSDLPADRLVDKETMSVVEEAVRNLPLSQRRVIALRDIEGWTAGDVCELLDLTEGNQRVLLHRARSRVRAALEAHLTATGAVTA